MKKKLLAGFLLFLMGLTSCSPSQTVSPDPPVEPETPPPTEESKIDLMDLEEWDLVWISDSSGWDVAQVFADYITEDTGIPVNVYDSWDGGLSAGTILEILQGSKHPNAKLAGLPEAIREAEVIVFYANPEESQNEDNPGDWNCGQSSFKTFVNTCEMDTFAVYIQHLEEIYELIFTLRDGNPTIIRAYDAYNPTLARWKDDGTFDICQACWGNYNAAIHQAAEAYKIPVAGVYDAWNGTNHDEDPNDKGYTKDGIHPNELGAQVIAEELRKLGYDPVSP